MPDKALIMYSRTIPCPDCARTRALLQSLSVPFQEVMIDEDPAARRVVESLTGFEAVPTLVVTRLGEARPFPDPRPLQAGRSPRGVDRGTVITEPDMVSLHKWLQGHGFVVG